MIGLLFRSTLWLSVLGGHLWCIGCLKYLFPPTFGTIAAGSYFFICLVSFFRMKDKRIWRQRIAASVLVICVIHVVAKRPRLDREWAADNARLASVAVEDDSIHVSNVRHSIYHSETDYEPHYQDLDFQLSDLCRAWFVVQRFTTLEGIAHNFLTFEIDSGSENSYFSVSVEIRREMGESFSPLKGLFREYELIYVIADERDEIGARTVFRPDDRVFLYPINATEEQVQALFLNIAERINGLGSKPEFYNSLLKNCTNSIVFHTYTLTTEKINWLDPRVVAPGYADRLAFQNDLLIHEPGELFEAYSARCRIDEIARANGITADFSQVIRSRQQQ